MFGASLVHGVKKARGLGGGGAQHPLPICKHNVFITGSERVHMGSVFAGRMMLEATLLSLKICQYNILRDNKMEFNMTSSHNIL